MRITAGGSYLIEFEDEKSAHEVETNWNEDHFNGNSGIVKPDEPNSTGIVKFVYNDMEEEELKDEIKQNYPGCIFDLFKRNDVFTGTIKVKFQNEGQLQNAVDNKFKIANRLYLVEPFKHKPRVIKCNVCQLLGHVSRICRNKDKPVCGKCSCEGHESKDCTKGEDEYKCFHCGKNDHITGSYDCEKVKERYQTLLDRKQNG